LRKAMSERLRAGDVLVVDDLKLGSSKTKEFVSVLSALELKGTTLIVAHPADKNLTLASRNVADVALTTGELLNTYDVLRPDKLVFTRQAFEQLEARLGKE
jgi:large subunit ribosomal protein L4